MTKTTGVEPNSADLAIEGIDTRPVRKPAFAIPFVAKLSIVERHQFNPLLPD
ncbi:hypothetical protein I552_2292 [Mycobacterium xenopi 3993]|nr:hypothetical protein I552_2292 [Mycobacterium xenopi 3993]